MFYKYILNLSKRELDNALRGKDGYLLTYRLICYINIVFSIREKYNIVVEEDNILSGLKRFYNILKHNYCPKTIFDSMCLLDDEERKNPVFMDISSIKDLRNQLSSKQELNQNYNDYIKGKSIDLISNYVFEKTIELLKNDCCI